jgi:hypothetical protein
MRDVAVRPIPAPSSRWHHRPMDDFPWDFWEHNIAGDDLLRERVEGILWLMDVVDRADREWLADGA